MGKGGNAMKQITKQEYMLCLKRGNDMVKRSKNRFWLMGRMRPFYLRQLVYPPKDGD
jgi:hypothetical protein